MTASRGPVPKRSDQRRRRNIPEVPTEKVTPDGAQRGPALGLELHPVAVEWYEALRVSAQAVFFEPSDWASAKLITTAIHDYLTAPRPSAQLLSAITATWAELLVTEGGRRRARIEIERGAVDADGARAGLVAVMDAYRRDVGATP